jgi:hypothetical protein
MYQEWVPNLNPLLLRVIFWTWIPEILGSNFGRHAGFAVWRVFMVFCLSFLAKAGMVPRWGNGRILSNPFQLIIHQSSYHFILYSLSADSIIKWSTKFLELSSSWEAASCAAIKNFPTFMESEGSLPCSQEPSTGPYPESDQSSSYHPHPMAVRSILILSSHLRLDLPSGLFSSGFPTNILYAFLVLHNLEATYEWKILSDRVKKWRRRLFIDLCTRCRGWVIRTLYSRHSYFSCLSGDLLTWLRVFIVFSVPPNKFRDSTWDYIMDTSFHILYISLFTNPSIRRFIAGLLKLTEHFSRIMALWSTQPLTEMSTRILPGGKGRQACKADNLTAICEATA